MDKKIFNSQSGVSLAELSIVITIIALLAAAVAGGISIKKASELQDIITDVGLYRTAIGGFEEKYRDLPGDMPDAHSYWDDGADGVCGTAAQCNGDGDGLIELGASSVDHESYRAWQHLDLTGFVEGGYTGLGGGSGGTATIPVQNAPETNRTDGAYFLYSFSAAADTGAGAILVGAYNKSVAAGTWSNGALLTPAEAYSIDGKMDDADPDDGKVQGRYYYTTSYQTSTCLSGSYPDRSYDRTRTDKECIMYFSQEP